MRQMLAAAVLLIALPSLCVAQSLAEAAAREREKRKGQKAGKVITEEELRRAGQSGRANVDTGAPAPDPKASPGAPGQAPGAAASPDAAKPKTDDEVRAEQEQAWRDKRKQVQEDVQRITQAVAALQLEINDATGNLYSNRRTTILSQLDKANTDLKAAQQQLAALDEEGRRSRFRP